MKLGLSGCFYRLLKVLLALVGLYILLCILVVIFLDDRPTERAKRVNCAGNLKQIGLSVMMYASDNDEFYPYDPTASVHNYDLLIQEKYIADGKFFNCPSREFPLYSASHSAYRYFGKGQVHNELKAKEKLLLSDRPWNHPKDAFRNYFYADGHVEGKDLK